MAELNPNAKHPPDKGALNAGGTNHNSSLKGSAGTRPPNPFATNSTAILCLGSAFYVRYKDHVLFKNISQPIADAVERETVGWLSRQTDDIMLIEHDRTISNPQMQSGQGSGVIILKSCIIEIRRLPLQKTLNCHLNCPESIVKGEYALQPKKRKTRKQKEEMAT